MSIRDELTKLIAEHLPEHRAVERMVGNCSCICGWEGIGETDADKTAKFAAHVTSTILARYAVVELPERSEDEYGHPATFQFGAIRRATVDRDGFIRPYNWMGNGGSMSPLAARETAAALLAAAKFASEASRVDR